MKKLIDIEPTVLKKLKLMAFKKNIDVKNYIQNVLKIHVSNTKKIK